jgi:hypothetical protein
MPQISSPTGPKRKGRELIRAEVKDWAAVKLGTDWGGQPLMAIW